MSVTERTENAGLRKDSLGVFAVTFFVVSAAGPLIAMAGGVPVSMLVGNGAGIPAMFLVVVAILVPFAAGLTAIVPHVKSAGGFYAIAGCGLGGHAAGASALIAILSYGLMQLSLFGLFGAAAATFAADRLQLHLPWWTYSIGALLLVGWLGYRQVDLSARVLAVLVVGEYLAVLLLDCAVLLHTPQAQFGAPFHPSVVMSGSPWIGLLMCFSAFIGFEATTIYAEEARNPDRTIPLATYISLLLIGGFYVFSSWCMVLAVGTEQLMPTLAGLPDPTAFLFRLAERFVGPWLAFVMHLLFLTSIFAGILAFHNSEARYLFAMGRERLLPQRMSHTHARHHSPHVASATQTALAILLVGVFAMAAVDPIVLFARASVAGTLGIIALMAIASTAVTWFFRDRPGNAWRIRVLPLFSTIALFVVMLLTGWHFDTLAGDRSPWVRSLPALVLVAGIVGLCLAESLRRSDRAAFGRLSRGEPAIKLGAEVGGISTRSEDHDQ